MISVRLDWVKKLTLSMGYGFGEEEGRKPMIEDEVGS